ncbi:MAG: hypothetical protein IPP61_20000 [Cytophagaceae bacterium]|nr:hypothetical protein [Cytophagaceae bacterium]
MKNLFLISFLAFLISCQKKTENNQIEGTWKLLSGTLIEKGDTTITDYTQGKSFIKIINDTHFAFFLHDLSKGKDSTATYSSGAGTFKLKGDQYSENLEYCSDRAWEGNSFNFTIVIKGDTLIQSGVEKIEKEGIDRLNIEKYVKLKN